MLLLWHKNKGHTPCPSQEGKYGADPFNDGKVASYTSPLERG